MKRRKLYLPLMPHGGVVTPNGTMTLNGVEVREAVTTDPETLVRRFIYTVTNAVSPSAAMLTLMALELIKGTKEVTITDRDGAYLVAITEAVCYNKNKEVDEHVPATHLA